MVSYVVTLFLCRFVFSECMFSHRRFRFNRCFAMSGDCLVNLLALLVVCLVILTSDVSYAIVPGRQYDLLWAFRSLTQILSDLICHHRPARKPPWRQYVEEELEANRRIRRWFIPYQQKWGLRKTKINDISFYMRVSINSKVLRCNRWIAAYDFRMRYRYFIYKKKMIPKQESHTKLTEMMKTIKYLIKYLIKKAERNLLYRFFIT